LNQIKYADSDEEELDDDELEHIVFYEKKDLDRKLATSKGQVVSGDTGSEDERPKNRPVPEVAGRRLPKEEQQIGCSKPKAVNLPVKYETVNQQNVLESKPNVEENIVTPPSRATIQWHEKLPSPVQRRHIQIGHRVKVVISGRWFGGLVTFVMNGEEDVSIKFDNGDREDFGFPNECIVVDDQGNGRHKVGARIFLSPLTYTRGS
jgi:hypothetical protein